jgi:hypothetical protein
MNKCITPVQVSMLSTDCRVNHFNLLQHAQYNLKAAAKHKHTYGNIRWVPVNWDTLGLGHFVPIKWLPQLCQVLCEDSKKCIKQETSYHLLCNKTTSKNAGTDINTSYVCISIKNNYNVIYVVHISSKQLMMLEEFINYSLSCFLD